jgi:hypothetical protein
MCLLTPSPTEGVISSERQLATNLQLQSEDLKDFVRVATVFGEESRGRGKNEKAVTLVML